MWHVGQQEADVQRITLWLDQCEENTTPFVQMMKRRHMQEESLCRGEGLTKDACHLLLEPRERGEERERPSIIHAGG